MENYILWTVSREKTIQALSFFATPTHVQRINSGTATMIAEMLSDLGASNATINSWHIDHFFSDYLSDDRESADWEDVWSETWEITVETPTVLEVPRSKLIRSYARDETWDGDFSPTLPGECVVVADFYEELAMRKARQVLELVAAFHKTPSLSAEVRAKAPEVSGELLSGIAQSYQRWKLAEPSFRIRAGQPYQLVINLGIVGDDFFQDRTNTASSIIDLCHGLGGTTTWNELKAHS
jgi:hypothetical protein